MAPATPIPCIVVLNPVWKQRMTKIAVGYVSNNCVVHGKSNCHKLSCGTLWLGYGNLWSVTVDIHSSIDWSTVFYVKWLM